MSNQVPATSYPFRNGPTPRIVPSVVPESSQTILLRLAAFVIDALVVSVLLVLPASILSYAMAWVGGTRSINLVWYGALLILLLGILLRDGRHGRSIGKRILGLQLITPGGLPCSYTRSFVRNLPLLIPGWNLIELYLVVFGKPLRTGDRIAKTSVIEE
ncbi:MAG: RDD family protein [Thermoanaerobaculia bacterium]